MRKVSAVLFAAIILMFSVVPALALESPQATTFKYDVIIIPTEGGDGSFEYETDIDEDGNQTIIIKPEPKPGYDFDHWEIDGPYKTEGKLTDEELEITIQGDVSITPIFKNPQGTVATGTIDVDNSDKSPKTGASDMALPIAVIILSLAACGFATVKLVKSK